MKKDPLVPRAIGKIVVALAQTPLFGDDDDKSVGGGCQHDFGIGDSERVCREDAQRLKQVS